MGGVQGYDDGLAATVYVSQCNCKVDTGSRGRHMNSCPETKRYKHKSAVASRKQIDDLDATLYVSQCNCKVDTGSRGRHMNSCPETKQNNDGVTVAARKLALSAAQRGQKKS